MISSKELPDRLEREGIELLESREISYGTQYRLRRGDESAILNLYYTGKVVVQGKESNLKRQLNRMFSGTVAGGGSEIDATPRVGVDEAGKGDFFGPLVVAGVRIGNREMAERLGRLGVRDSKSLTGGRVGGISDALHELLGPGDLRIISLSPPEYETRRAAAGSVNRLLAELNAEILQNLREGVERFVVDDFGSARALIEPLLPQPGPFLEVRPRAEDDTAVAAASILARARFLSEMAALSDVVGVELPRGSTHVKGTARRLLQEKGLETLAKVAKISFSITNEL